MKNVFIEYLNSASFHCNVQTKRTESFCEIGLVLTSVLLCMNKCDCFTCGCGNVVVVVVVYINKRWMLCSFSFVRHWSTDISILFHFIVSNGKWKIQSNTNVMANLFIYCCITCAVMGSIWSWNYPRMRQAVGILDKYPTTHTHMSYRRSSAVDTGVTKVYIIIIIRCACGRLRILVGSWRDVDTSNGISYLYFSFWQLTVDTCLKQWHTIERIMYTSTGGGRRKRRINFHIYHSVCSRRVVHTHFAYCLRHKRSINWIEWCVRVFSERMYAYT